KDYNIIVIALESVRASLLGYYGAPYGVSPHLDAFAREHMVANQFYANSNFTAKAETSIWCSIFDHNVKPPLSRFAGEIAQLNCLPQILQEQGYRTVFFHGNKAGFYGRDQFLPKVGFAEMEFFDAQRAADEGLSVVGW